MILVPGSGPSPAKAVLLGEAPGLNEEIYGAPFVGEAGDELTRMLKSAGLDRKDFYVTNVFKTRPEDNNVELFFTTRSDPDADLSLPARNGKYLRSKFRPMVDATRDELVRVGPQLVLALGATALWHCLGQSKIGSFVGTLHAPTPGRPFYVLPSYHPAAVLRQWSFRSTVVANFLKAKDLLDKSNAGGGNGTNGRGTPSPQFHLAINPTLGHVLQFARRTLSLPPGSDIAVDIETFHGQITCVGFATGPAEAICIPFWVNGSSYWPDLQSEVAAWGAIKSILGRRDATFIFQNGPYDQQWLWRGYGILVLGNVEDTMWAHHALEPELPKGLGPMAATYLKIPEWKTSRVSTSKDEE